MINKNLRKKIAKTIAMVGSQYDGEGLNAWRLADVLRREADVEWEDLLNGEIVYRDRVVYKDRDVYIDRVVEKKMWERCPTEWLIDKVLDHPSLTKEQMIMLETAANLPGDKQLRYIAVDLGII